jgi:hypothetical protein
MEKLLDKMRRGEQTGIMFVSSSATGDDLTGCYGAFADRLQYAVYAATKQLNGLVDRIAEGQGAGHSVSESFEDDQPSKNQELPRMLRLGVR